jgi:hypothetical protein
LTYRLIRERWPVDISNPTPVPKEPDAVTKLLELDEGQFFIYNHCLYLVTHIELESDIIQHVAVELIGVKRIGTSTPLSFHRKPDGNPERLGPEVFVELLT